MKKKIEVCLSPRDFDLYKEGFEIIALFLYISRFFAIKRVGLINTLQLA